MLFQSLNKLGDGTVMKVRFWGTRGSIAKPGPSTVRFGGNTSCIEVRSNSGTLVILDCGTGAHGLGQALINDGPHPLRGHILITHTHWDHIQGIPFFAPLFEPENEWDIYAPRGLGSSLREALAGQMQYTYFPVTLEKLGATIRYHDLIEGVFEIEDIKVQTHYMNHPALTLGYRLESDGISLVYACDHEPHSREYAMGTGKMGEQDRRHIDFIRGADLVIHDAQYTAKEYADKVGWGHTTVDCAIDMCQVAGVRRLALTHHDPLREDDGVDFVCQNKQKGLTDSEGLLEVFAAAEGMLIEVEASLDIKEENDKAKLSAISKFEPALYEHKVLIGTTDEKLANRLKKAAKADQLQIVRGATSEDILKIICSEQMSVVILEDELAGKDSLEICRTIRELNLEYVRDLPVIVVSDSELDAGIEAGVTDWLIHPFTQEYARTKLRAWIMRSTSRWKRAPLPADEEYRLEALHELKILDSEPEERFNRITRITAEAFDVPITLISLIDKDRQWFKSRFGLSATETPRDQAFCAHAILEKDIMVVRDALLDPRFADNPLVLDNPRIRFYAGYPLTMPNGSALGTLCIIDTRPRDIDDAKLELLRELGRLAEKEIAD
jgi:phosphoribosyl 1,2-cyclic phosphodiesterase/DNA-binding response OmpR family regulator